ncbi:hypothetical protein OQA88_13267, partial [Cercophora sp. LCS_1]
MGPQKLWSTRQQPQHQRMMQSQRPAFSCDERRTSKSGRQQGQTQISEYALASTLGKNVAAHGDIFIDLVTFASVFTVTLKLASSSLPRGIQTAAWILVAGWVALHALILIFHATNRQSLGQDQQAAADLMAEIRLVYKHPDDDRCPLWMMLAFGLGVYGYYGHFLGFGLIQRF